VTIAAPEDRDEEVTLTIEGMTCASCVAHVEKAARKLPGVESASVSLAGGRATVRYDPGQTAPDRIAAAITDAGYPSSATGEERNQPQHDHGNSWRWRTALGITLWLPVELAHWIHHAFFTGMSMPGMHQPELTWIDWLAVITSTVSIIAVGSAFYRSAWAALKHRTTNMDTLIAMGTSVAYGYSAIALLGYLLGGWRGLPELYFMEASGLLALISLGHYLEARARTSAGGAIRALLHLSPETALRLPSGVNDPQTVAVASLAVGDRLLVRPGDRVPIDGVVIDGRSSVDESMITGESIPVLRAPGDAVLGGTINQDGRLTIRVSKVGSATALAQIVKLVEKAQDSKPPIQKLADQIAAVFVPSVLAIALFTGIAWFAWGSGHHWEEARTWSAIARAVCSVLIIACPCALGLAVPVSIMVGTGIGARRGILIRDIDAIQQAEKIQTVLLDKTGTITLGKPAVVDVRTSDGMAADELLRLAASVEQYSEHPLAKAIVSHARSSGIKLTDPSSFQNEPGDGVRSMVDGRSLLVGSDALLARHGATATAAIDGRTRVSVAQLTDGVAKLLGTIALADQIKTDSAKAVAALRAMGLRVALLSGDNRAAAEAVAKLVGIDDVQAEVKPDQKAKAVETYRLDHRGAVAMVGDGINDAPALAAADLGIAIGAGSDIAKETAGIVLVKGSLTDVAVAIQLSRATMRTIRQNLFLAFVYNVLAIPLAALGLLNPMIAAAAMALSDVTVIGNALRLQWRRDRTRR
jgi:Cu+-exporting ATPase